MDKRFYPRLAWDCLRKNGRFYLPYLLTVAGAVAGFYILATTADLAGLADRGDVALIMQLCTVVLGLVCCGFLLYTNSFLMKQRGREFGLYAVLGLDRSNMTRLLAWETVFTALIGVGGGLAAGVLLDRMMLLILAKLTGLPYSGPVVYGMCLLLTAGVFVAVLTLIFLVNAAKVGALRPAELLIMGNVGDKEPKSRWFIALVGVILLGAGYSVAIGQPGLMEHVELADILWFFVAVLLVIAGTFALFLAGTVVGLKLLRRWKRYYYQPRHFVSVSGLIHRMGRGAAGLAIICILSTAVLVMVSSTVCLYAGLESNLRHFFNRDVEASFGCEAQMDWDSLLESALETARGAGYHPQNIVRYDRLICSFAWTDGESWENAEVLILDEEGYESLTGQEIALAPDQTLTTVPGDTLTILNIPLASAGTLGLDDPAGIYLTGQYREAAIGQGVDLAVVSEETLERLYDAFGGSFAENEMFSYNYSTYIEHCLDFDLLAGEDTDACLKVIRRYVVDRFRAMDLGFSDGSRAIGTYRPELMAAFGSLLFLGLFLGTLFLGGAALLIYYKQVSEGYEDRERFAIMRKVGMDQDLVRRSIHSQILLVFFLPLITAFCHMAAAFPLVARLLEIWDMRDTNLFLLCTLGSAAVFAALYTAVYLLTARVYSRLVGQ